MVADGRHEPRRWPYCGCRVERGPADRTYRPGEFCEKICAGKAAQATSDFQIFARLESLILGSGIDDALMRARAYLEAGADGIMIHSRRCDGGEVLEFTSLFRDPAS